MMSEMKDFDTLSPHRASTIFVTLRVDTPLTTDSTRDSTRDWSIRWYFSNSPVENSPERVRGTLSLRRPTGSV